MRIRFQDVSYIYNRKTPFEYVALDHIDFEIPEHKLVALVGRTGSGKSTLVSHINALLRPTSGEVHIGSFLNAPKNRIKPKEIKELRKHVGLVFQFPEYQLFEETVEKDVAFGPHNFGLSNEEALKRAHEAILRVGLNESFFTRSPFELSGGEKRKVAIAGVIATNPEVLIVDEPTAGLDPVASLETMGLFKEIQKQGTSVILVTHDMSIVNAYADEVVVLENGKIATITTPKELFKGELSEYSLDLPLLYQVIKDLKNKGMDLTKEDISDLPSLVNAIKRYRHE